ncbi:SAM-dependent methyltransferase [Nocardioidaceae bacterium]|nr:SAM-dependent methyltransferase [Nocardioidaceae bacterium]
MDVETLAWLRTPDGAAALAEARAGLTGGADDLAVATALRRRYEPQQAAAALTQVQLRTRAVEKFGADAARMWFTAEALEQATRGAVAAHRATRLALAARAAGATWSLVDLGCGVGGDLVAAARAGLVVAGVDRDPVRVACAAATLQDLALPGAVTVADAEQVDVGRFDVALCDPARRDGTGRTWSPDAWSPPWSFVQRLLTGTAVVKAAPGLPHDAVPDGVEAEFVSDGGSLKEAALWSGPLATCRRRATVLGDHVPATLTDADDPGPEAVGTGPVGAFLLEPDDAVVRAGLVTALAAAAGGRLVDPHLAYVTAEAPVVSSLARSYRVREEVPFREKALRAALRERGIGRLSIKKRGVQVTPEQLRPRLALRGDAEATLVLARTPQGARAFLVDPVDPRHAVDAG